MNAPGEPGALDKGCCCRGLVTALVPRFHGAGTSAVAEDGALPGCVAAVPHRDHVVLVFRADYLTGEYEAGVQRAVVVAAA